MPWMRYLGNRLMSYLASKLTGYKFYDVSCGFRAYSRQAMLSLNLHEEFTYTHESFLNLVFKKLRVLEIPLKVRYFNNRQSKVASNFLTYGINTIKIYLKIYLHYMPLRFFMLASGFFCILSIFFEAILLWALLTKSYPELRIWFGFLGFLFLSGSLVFFVVGLLAGRNRKIIDQHKQPNVF